MKEGQQQKRSKTKQGTMEYTEIWGPAAKVLIYALLFKKYGNQSPTLIVGFKVKL